MHVYCNGTARIRHRSSGEIHEIDSDLLDWDVVCSDERQMGPELHHEAVIEHPELGKLSWGLWEYPEGVENHQETNAGPHHVVEDFDYGLEHDGPEYDDEWLELPPPDNPFAQFQTSYRESTDLLARSGSDAGNRLVNRLVFSQQVTALEAYLGDTLKNEVLRDLTAMQRLLEADEDLKKEKVTLLEVFKDSGFVQKKVRDHLRRMIYHNLAKVDALYKIALGIGILDLATDRKSMFDAVLLRHDCVHRNGADDEGRPREVFSKVFVQQTADFDPELGRRHRACRRRAPTRSR